MMGRLLPLTVYCALAASTSLHAPAPMPSDRPPPAPAFPTFSASLAEASPSPPTLRQLRAVQVEAPPETSAQASLTLPTTSLAWALLRVPSSEQPPAAKGTAPSSAPCLGEAAFPLRGVRYAPHMIGEPYPLPNAEPPDFYGKGYSQLHRRDLSMIGGILGADTLVLRPWPTGGDGQADRQAFFGQMRREGICNMIPTFQASRHFADMIEQGIDKPDTDPNGALVVDFLHFGASLQKDALSGVSAVAWTIDLSLDLAELLPMVGESCLLSSFDRSLNFQRYMALLEVLGELVFREGSGESLAPALQDIPFLLPLDIAQAHLAGELSWERLEVLLDCMSTDDGSGGWSPLANFSAFSNGSSRALAIAEQRLPQVQWLLSFAVPFGQSPLVFHEQLLSIMASIKDHAAGAVIMVGTQALRRVAGNPANGANLIEDFNSSGIRQSSLFSYYEEARAVHANLHGFIYDEWMDDWDRGSRGPFVLASSSIEEMAGSCKHGSRFDHDVRACSRGMNSQQRAYPEFFGLSSSSSRLLSHCVRPRFGRSLFRSHGDAPETTGTVCSYVLPSLPWLAAAAACLGVVAFFELRRLLRLCGAGAAAADCCGGGAPRRAMGARQPEADCGAGAVVADSFGDEVRGACTGWVPIAPERVCLRGGHRFELQSARLRSDPERGWWLWTHVSVQMEVLEKQIAAEVLAMQAIAARKRVMAAPAIPVSSHRMEVENTDATDAGQVAGAVRVIHRRVLEGFACWCAYAAKSGTCGCSSIRPKALRDAAHLVVAGGGERDLARLFAEALLLRVMESLSEHIIHCPERLSYLFFKSVMKAGGFDEAEVMTYLIDLDELQDGLIQMSLHSNPYTLGMTPAGDWERGLNFDDINDSGIQCRQHVTKTFKEPVGPMVLIDFFLHFRTPIMLKLYCTAIAGYLYLGSHLGDDLVTKHNGSLRSPQWLRINYIQFMALVDAAVWALTEAVLMVYVLWQRWPSIGFGLPDLPGPKWLVKHGLLLLMSSIGGACVYSHASFARKPWDCAEASPLNSDACVDPRADRLFEYLQYALAYWACRVVLFGLTNVPHAPVFLPGRASGSGRQWRQTQRKRLRADCSVAGAWAAMLGACVIVELTFILPAMRGLDLGTACGWDVLGDVFGLPVQQGSCSEAEELLTSKCSCCLASVALAWALCVVACTVDLYFVFNVACGIVGGAMGHGRCLNDLKNTALHVDLRKGYGREAGFFERALGPEWKKVWCAMVTNLLAESLVSRQDADELLQAAGTSLSGLPLVEHSSGGTINLARLPHLAAERLALFFQSLKWIQQDHTGKGMHFEPATDALTGPHFHPGSVPSLTQIIPAFNETVIPSVDFLIAGSAPQDACDSCADGSKLGDSSLPPRGDGVNTNLAFMISQFAEEWKFLVERLHHEGMPGHIDAHQLYERFIDRELTAAVEFEVRIWAALRMQSVAKTVLGALQCSRALTHLTPMREHYARMPSNRVGEHHVEVILAHQTFGHSDGREENDMAVQQLLERHADDPLFLVFDLNRGSSRPVRALVDAFIEEQGAFDGYNIGALEQASVKCKWDKALGRLRVLNVLPRKFPLRIGQGDFKTQGKAGNQLNALRFASGHYIQALDCNMGTFIGEAFKVPYILRMFMPLDQEDRAAPRCRLLGFREHIYTGREGALGRCVAGAEWTFGTIYQRFLSGLGVRMHYGHPDFLDAFWARNRGGMSKASPIVNLSEDIFSGFNVRMREEVSMHIDALEFEKGRETSFVAANNFCSKISCGSVASLRSRDTHLLCERIGLVHALSFYFASVAFYVNNVLLDASIYLYIVLLIMFDLAGVSLSELQTSGSMFSIEWTVSIGMVSLLPQFLELVLECGFARAVKDIVGGLATTMLFMIFQQKTIATSVWDGVTTGIARYVITGRPLANQHQTWKALYLSYWRTHYRPALKVLTGYLIYHALAAQKLGEGGLPMALVVTHFSTWLIAPIVFSPFPRCKLILQNVRDFNSFIIGLAGSSQEELSEVEARGKSGQPRSLYECCLAQELSIWTGEPLFSLILGLVFRFACALYLAAVLPSVVTDFLPVCFVIMAFAWILVLAYLVAGQSNIFLTLSSLLFLSPVVFSRRVMGGRISSPGIVVLVPEYLISFVVFLFLLDLGKHSLLVTCRSLLGGKRGATVLSESVRNCFVYCFVYQLYLVEAYAILCINFLVAGFLALVDWAFCNVHTACLFNSELGQTKPGHRYMERAVSSRHGSQVMSVVPSVSDSESDELSGWGACHNLRCEASESVTVQQSDDERSVSMSSHESHVDEVPSISSMTSADVWGLQRRSTHSEFDLSL